MKKVLHLFPAYKIGGAPINVLRFIKGSKGKIINYAVALSVDEKMFKDYVSNTENSFDVDLTSLNRRSFLKLLKIVKQVKPDVIHANGKAGAIYSLLVYPFYRSQVFYTFRGFHIKFSGLKQRAYVLFEKLYSCVYSNAIAVSHSEKNLFLSTVGVKEEKVRVIGNGVEIRRMPLPKHMQEIVNVHEFNLVTFSRIAEVKDLETMVRAFEALNDTNIALHIMGGYLKADKNYKKNLDRLIGNLSCKGRIYLWGDVERAGDYLHNFDLYLSTSISEGLPTSIIESGLSEVLVLATSCNGNIDLVIDGVTGHLFSIGDVIGLAVMLRKAIDELGSESQCSIIENNLKQMKYYSIKGHVDKLVNLYLEKY